MAFEAPKHRRVESESNPGNEGKEADEFQCPDGTSPIEAARRREMNEINEMIDINQMRAD